MSRLAFCLPLTAGKQLEGAMKLLKLNPRHDRPEVRILLDLPESCTVKIHLQDARGEELSVLNQGLLDAGAHEFCFSSFGLLPGTYFCLLELDGYNVIQSFALPGPEGTAGGSGRFRDKFLLC